MKKQRIYLDNSVLGGCFDDEFRQASNQLMDEFAQAIHQPVLSLIVEREAKHPSAPAMIGEQFDWLYPSALTSWSLTQPPMIS